jgi:hypothetical protein
VKRGLRTAAAALALTLSGFGLTGCLDTDDDCDASSTTTVHYEAAAFTARVGGTSGGRGGGGFKSRPHAPKSKPRPGRITGGTTGGIHHHDHDDCEDDD